MKIPSGSLLAWNIYSRHFYDSVIIPSTVVLLPLVVVQVLGQQVAVVVRVLGQGWTLEQK